MVVHEEPELGELDGDLRDLVAACLAKDPAARPGPDEVADRLAAVPAGPEAAARAAGWLPGPLVEQISRAAVELLHLDSLPLPPPEPTGPLSPPEPTGPLLPTASAGPVPPTASAVEPGASGPVAFSSPAIGVFGPPVDPGTRGQPPTAWGPQPGPQPPNPAQPSDPAQLSGPTQPSDPTRPSTGLSLSVGGRSVSCTLALTVAGALAAVTVGAGLLLDTWRGGGDADKGNVGAQPPAASASASPPAAGAAQPVDEVPTEFVGTWSGPSVERSGAPHGTLTVTVTEGKKGEDVVRTTTSLSVLSVTVECHGIGRLAAGSTTRKLRIEERTDTERPSRGPCTGGDAVLDLTLAEDGTLRYRSHEDAAGRPTATLTKKPG
jgi:hypothetical protein